METGMVPDAAMIADRLAIQDVLAMHSRGVDRADETILKSCYWPDATVAYGGFNGNAHEFCAYLPQGIRRYWATQHTITNTRAEFNGKRAAVETYVTAYHYHRNDDGSGTEMTYLGRYLDRFEKRDNCWKIHHRQVLMDWNQNSVATSINEGPPFDGLARGARHPEDPLYAMLEQLRG